MLRRSLIALMFLTVFAVVSPTMASASSIGQINFIRNASSSFDPILTGSTASQRQWMSQTYWRMRAYPPFFDQALSWARPSDFYFDLYALYRDASDIQTLMQQHPDWVLRDSQGRPLFIPTDCDGTSCTQYAGDFGNPGFRAWWISRARTEVAKGYQGVFIDDVNMDITVGNGAGQAVTPIDPRTSQLMTDSNWRRYVAEFTEAIRTALPGVTITHNTGWWNDESDPYVKREIDSADILELERGFNDGGLVYGNGPWSVERFMSHIDWLHARGKSVILEPYNLNAAKREYEMASLWMVKGPNDAIASDFQADPDNWWPGWQTDLGTPHGSRYQWNGLWRRDYSGGFVLTNEPYLQARTVQLGGVYDRLSGGSVSSVTLDGGTGAVLLRQTPPPPPPPSDPPPSDPPPSDPPPSNPPPSDPTPPADTPSPTVTPLNNPDPSVHLAVRPSHGKVELSGHVRSATTGQVAVTVQRYRDGRWQPMTTRNAALLGDGSFRTKAAASQGRYRASAVFHYDQGSQTSSGLRLFRVR